MTVIIIICCSHKFNPVNVIYKHNTPDTLTLVAITTKMSKDVSLHLYIYIKKTAWSKNCREVVAKSL